MVDDIVNVIGEAVDERRCAIAQTYLDTWNGQQLAAMTAARDEACTMIQTLVDAQARYSPAEVATSAAFAAMKREIDERIAKLRRVGQ